jgi:hypothetical protein
MCFSQEMSGFFSVFGLFVAYWVWNGTHNKLVTSGVIYFVLMEVLQFFQFFWINDCASQVNQFLTIVGFAHICFQPYFTHAMNFGVLRNPTKVAWGVFVRRLCLIQGAYMFSRWVFVDMETVAQSCDIGKDWLAGEKLCTYMGTHHLAWEMPLHNATYFWPSNNVHFFMMFAPFLAGGLLSTIPGVILFLTGPYLASQLTDNLHEQASVWCFFSIAQITILTLYMRITLGSRWGQFDSEGNLLSSRALKALKAGVSASGKSASGKSASGKAKGSKKKKSTKKNK